MDMTYSEFQTPLFSPSYLNLVFENHPWKTGESPHNTDCDATVGDHASKDLHIPPLNDKHCTAESSEEARIREKMADHGNKCYVPGCPGDVRTFHTLPTENKCQQAWLMFIYNRIPQQFHSKLLVCSAHFTTDLFSNLGQYQASLSVSNWRRG